MTAWEVQHKASRRQQSRSHYWSFSRFSLIPFLLWLTLECGAVWSMETELIRVVADGTTSSVPGAKDLEAIGGHVTDGIAGEGLKLKDQSAINLKEAERLRKEGFSTSPPTSDGQIAGKAPGKQRSKWSARIRMRIKELLESIRNLFNRFYDRLQSSLLPSLPEVQYTAVGNLKTLDPRMERTLENLNFEIPHEKLSGFKMTQLENFPRLKKVEGLIDRKEYKSSMFRAVSYLVHGDQNSHEAIRADMVAHIRKNPEEYLRFFPRQAGENTDPFADVEKFCQSMELESTPGNVIALKALSEKYGLNIAVLSKDEEFVCLSLHSTQEEINEIKWKGLFVENGNYELLWAEGRGKAWLNNELTEHSHIYGGIDKYVFSEVEHLNLITPSKQIKKWELIGGGVRPVLKSKNLIGGGPDSLFKAISYAVYGTKGKHRLVRSQMVEHVKTHPSDYALFLPHASTQGLSSNQAILDYCKFMATKAAHGDDLCLRALSNIYKLDLAVLTDIKNPTVNLKKADSVFSMSLYSGDGYDKHRKWLGLVLQEDSFEFLKRGYEPSRVKFPKEKPGSS